MYEFMKKMGSLNKKVGFLWNYDEVIRIHVVHGHLKDIEHYGFNSSGHLELILQKVVQKVTLNWGIGMSFFDGFLISVFEITKSEGYLAEFTDIALKVSSLPYDSNFQREFFT